LLPLGGPVVRAFTRRPRPSVSFTPWLAGERPPRPLRSFAPPGRPVLATIPTLARARTPGPCSPGLFSPPELAPRRSWVRFLAATYAARAEPVSHPSPGTRSSRCNARSRTPAPGSSPRNPCARAVDRTTHATVRQRPKATALTRRERSSAASPARKRTERVARAPSRRRPAPPAPLATRSP